MKPFSIIITGASNLSYWYANRIGETLGVIGTNPEENCFEVDVSHLGMNKNVRAWVQFNDCKRVTQPESTEKKEIDRLNSPLETVYRENTRLREMEEKTATDSFERLSELDLLRRVAEAAYDVYSMRSWEPNTIIAKQRELLQALKAWKAGTK